MHRHDFMTDVTFDTNIPTQFKMASKPSQANKIHYVTAKKNINTLQEKADQGDMGCSLAVFDFYQSIKDPTYTISYSGSKKLLGDLALLDDKGNIHKATREAFKQHEGL